MLLRPASLAAAGLAASAQAFLLPPDVSKADIDSDSVSILPVDVPVTAEFLPVNLPCPGCPLRVAGPKGVITTVEQPEKKQPEGQPGSSHLELNFEVDHQPSFDRLTVNGFPLYPVADPFSSTLSAPHLLDADDADDADRKPGHTVAPAHPDLSFSLAVKPQYRDEKDQLDLIYVDLQVLGVGNSLVDNIPNVRVKLIQSPDGALMMGNVEVAESENRQHAAASNGDSQCTSIMCRWHAVVQAQLASLRKSCHDKQAASHAISEDKDRPVHPPQERPHHRYGNELSWARLFRRIASHILLPILVGILAGVTASFLGMLVGTLLVAGWRKVMGRTPSRRSRRRSTHSRRKSAAMRETAVSEEKAGLMQHQEAPPAYEEPESKPAEV